MADVEEIPSKGEKFTLSNKMAPGMPPIDKKLAMNDLENGIREQKVELKELQLFENSQAISESERKKVAERRRGDNMRLQFLTEELQRMKREIRAFVTIYSLIFVLIVLVHLGLQAAKGCGFLVDVYLVICDQLALLKKLLIYLSRSKGPNDDPNDV